MASLRPPSAAVQADPPPFRQLVAPPAASYWKDDSGAVHVLLSSRRKADAYEIVPLSTDLGGCAVRWHKRGGESYDVLLRGTDSSCSCAGWAYTAGCKHIQTTFELLSMGVLSVAPDTAAGDGDAA